MNIKKQINREMNAHGERWNAMHEGYFSDSVIANPYITAITQYLSGSNTDVLVDLGGGTGFILRELISKGSIKNIIPVNLDCSATQLNAMEKNGISCVNGLISDFRRNDLVTADKRIFFIMRSVLHYFGNDGLSSVLQHVRDQTRTGEMFIHQSACFENATEALCLNTLYQKMNTPKWYPTISELRNSMKNTNWEIIDVLPAPPLKLSSGELGQRYGIDADTMAEISVRLMAEHGEIENIFQLAPDGFTAYLHYRICVSQAA